MAEETKQNKKYTKDSLQCHCLYERSTTQADIQIKITLYIQQQILSKQGETHQCGIISQTRNNKSKNKKTRMSYHHARLVVRITVLGSKQSGKSSK